jgi:MFS transporter, OFA family, oxalate/formate antiporter
MGFHNRWLRGAIPALLIHCSIGSVYAWSMFVTEISKYIEKPSGEVQFAFSLAIFFLGISAAFGGKLVEKNVHRSSLVAMICFCSGLLLTALGLKLKSLLVIYLGYGCVMGIGLGIGYLTPVKTLMMWFKDNKGLSTGIAIMGFGLAKTIASPIISGLMSNTSLEMTFVWLAVIYIGPMFLGHLLIKKPYAESVEESEKFSVTAILKNRTFILIWFAFFLNIHCGLALISNEKPIMTELGFAAGVITIVASATGIFNAIGRLSLATSSDYMKDRSTAYRIIFIIAVSAVTLAMFGEAGFLFIILLCVINAIYGGGFSCLPPLLSDHFNMQYISRVHGLCLTAWAVAGLTGNQMASLIYSQTGTYTSILYTLAPLYTIALVLAFLLKKKAEENKASGRARLATRQPVEENAVSS